MARRLIGAVVLLVALTGCGGDPKTDPPRSPSPSTTPVSTTPSAPAMPDAAKENSKAGAIAFARYFIAVFNEAQRTGQTGMLSQLSAPECQACGLAINKLNDLYGAGGQIQGGDLDPGPVTAVNNAVEQTWLILLRVDSGPQSVKTAASAQPTSFPGGRRSMKFGVRRDGDAWKVISWART